MVAPLLVMLVLVTALMVGGVVSDTNTVTLPSALDIAASIALGVDATMPFTVTGMDPTDAPDAMLICTLAIIPEARAFWFTPNTRMRTPPEITLLKTLLPAFVAAWPAEIVPLDSGVENIRSK